MATKKQTEESTELVAKGEQDNSLVVLSESGYALARFTTEQLTEAVLANFGDEELTPNDLDRVRVPSGGGIAWEIPTLDGDAEVAKAIEGVMVLYRQARAYWRESLEMSGGGSPPDCTSPDGKTGIGLPGGACATCPLNQFGSHDKGRGKACKEMRLLFIVRPESLLPIVMVLPPTSIKPFKKYLQRLTSAALPYPRVQTSFTLTRETNKDGIDYAQVSFRVVNQLDPASAEHVARYAEGMRSAFEAVQITADDAMGDSNI